jgi:large subunit ribosomal protein L22
VRGEQGIDLDVDNLYVKLALANDGPRMKRIRPAPMGRAFRYQRRLTHIVLSVAERAVAAGLVTKADEPAAAAKTKTPAKTEAAAKAKSPAKPKAATTGATKKKAAKKA